MENTKDIVDANINFQYKLYKNCNQYFDEEISSFNEQLILRTKSSSIQKTWNLIHSYISRHMLIESYLKLSNNKCNILSKDSTKTLFNNIQQNEFIELRRLGIGSTYTVNLIYHIEKKKLLAIKHLIKTDEINRDLLKREKNNYSRIEHPLIPKFYGPMKDEDYLIIEYIDGQTIDKIKKLQLKDDDKYSIILQILTVIKYLHSKHLIYRDLKPNNIIINKNKIITLIDYDRLIKYDINVNQTNDLSSNYVAPDINDGNMQESCDIYSIGQIIYFIMKEIIPNADPIVNLNKFNENPELKHLYLKCANQSPEKRPKISELINDFYTFIADKSVNLTYLYHDMQYEFGLFLINHNKYEKAIECFTLASKQNHVKSQCLLGVIHLDNTYNVMDINKSIYYFTQASNNNDVDAQYNLGNIYLEGKYIKQDINKSIHYFTLASYQNDPQALYNLGLIYIKGQNVERNVILKKSIYFFTLSANQNNLESQLNLGKIYYDGKYINRCINKAINYFTLASNQNHPEAQFNLGLIYYNGQYVSRDINKAIHYFYLHQIKII